MKKNKDNLISNQQSEDLHKVLSSEETYGGKKKEKLPKPPEKIAVPPEGWGEKIVEVEEPEERPDFLENKWEEARKRLEKEHLVESKVPSKTREFMDKTLEKDADEKRIDFLLREFNEHEEELKQSDNLPIEEMSKEKKVSYMISQGGLEQLENNPAYEKDREEIDKIYLIQEGLKKNPPDLEAQFLSLHYFYNKTVEARDDLKAKRNNPSEYSEIEIHQAEANWKNCSKSVKDMAEQLLGKNVQKEAERHFTESEGTQKEFVKKRFLESEQDLRKRFEKSIADKIPEDEDLKKSGIERVMDKLSVRGVADKDAYAKDILAFINSGHSIEDLENLEVKNTSIVDRMLYKFKIYKSEGKPESQHIVFEGKDYPKSQWDKMVKDAREKFEADFKEKSAKDLAKEWLDRKNKFVIAEQDKIIKEMAMPEGENGIKAILDKKFEALKEKLSEAWQKEQKTAPKAEKAKPEKLTEEQKKTADNLLGFLNRGDVDTDIIATLLEEAGVEKPMIKERAKAWKEKPPTFIELIRDIFEITLAQKNKGRKSGTKNAI